MDSLLLGIDLGSSSSKGMIVDLSGNILGKASIKHTFDQPEANWAEQNPDITWWPECIEIIKTCINIAQIDPHRIKGIAITGMVPNLCILDKVGNSVRPAIFYRDGRTMEECSYLNETFGLNFNLQDMLPKWYWIKKHEPDNYVNIKAVLNTHSYLIYKLTGQYSIDCDTATLFGEIFDLETLEWKRELVKKIGLDPDALPPIYSPTAAVGTVLEEICKITGLAKNTPVYAGNGDSLLSMIGSGVVGANDLMMYLGTAATLIGTTTDLEELVAGPAFNSGSIHFIGNVLSGAECLKWFKEKLQLNNNLTYELLDEMAEKISPGCNGLITLSHMEGQRTPVYNPIASGSFLGLNNKHTAAHIYRSILESISYAMLESMLPHRNMFKRFVVSGGAGKSKLFRQIIADIFNITIEYSPKGEAALGAAYFAGYSLGLFKDFTTLRKYWLSEIEITKPILKNVEIYEKHFSAYVQIDKTIATLYPLLYDLKRGDNN